MDAFGCCVAPRSGAAAAGAGAFGASYERLPALASPPPKSCASEDEPGFEALKPNGFAPSSPSYGSGSSASIRSNA